MPRFILIDNYSGYVYGDTAALPAHRINGRPITQSDLTGDEGPLLAAEWMDEAEGIAHGRTYERRQRASGDECGYRVYRADIAGSDAIGAIRDGQDQVMIDAVLNDCPFECFVAVTEAP